MGENVIAWDIETVPDISAAGRMLQMSGATEAEIRTAMGDGFPKHPLHKIVCIGALIAERRNGVWEVKSLGAPHLGQRPESHLITDFVGKIAELRPQLVTFNGKSFDIPVLRYRAMVNHVSAPGLFLRNYFNRYTEDALDLCDALSSFDGRSKMKLDDLCKILSLRGKPDGIDGSQVETMVAEGRINEVAAYCECDVINTYHVWLHYQLFRGALSVGQFDDSASALTSFLADRTEKKPHLALFALGASVISPALPLQYDLEALRIGSDPLLEHMGVESVDYVPPQPD